MRIQTLITISLLIAFDTVLAGQPAVEGAATQMLKDKATEAAPKEAVEGVQTTDKSVEKAKMLKEGAEKAPEALQEQAKEAVTQKAGKAIPGDATQGAKAVKEGANTATKAKSKLTNPSQTATEAGDAAKGKAQQKATDKALDLLN